MYALRESVLNAQFKTFSWIVVRVKYRHNDLQDHGVLLLKTQTMQRLTYHTSLPQVLCSRGQLLVFKKAYTRISTNTVQSKTNTVYVFIFFRLTYKLSFSFGINTSEKQHGEYIERLESMCS